MFIRFAIRLISNGYVAEPVEGTQFTKDAINRCRGSNTVFPFVVDDVDKGNVERDIVKTYWEGAGMAQFRSPHSFSPVTTRSPSRSSAPE